MIFDRTMMFGFTLRNDIPTSSRIVMLAEVILAWIQRLAYLARKMHRMIAKADQHDDQERGRRSASGRD